MISASEKERYQRYLCSREWAERRKLVLTRSGGKCERCRAADASHVHHLTYARKYRELPEDLQALCEACHEFIHGKRDRDPLRSVPPRILGREIRSVYVAGKISGTDWRDQIVTGTRSYGVSSGDDEWFEPGVISVPDSSYRLDYRGPFYLDTLSGHGGPWHNVGKHAYAEQRGHTAYETSRHLVRFKSFKGVAQSDLLFAWVDSPDCYGTLAEIAFAYALRMKAANPPIVVLATLPDFDDSDLWFPLGVADLHINEEATPGYAWRTLWRWASS